MTATKLRPYVAEVVRKAPRLVITLGSAMVPRPADCLS